MRILVYALRKYSLAARVAVRNAWQYPAEQLGPVLSYGLFVFVFSRIWATAFAATPSIAGYSQFSATWYFVVAELCVMAANGSFNQLSRDIKDGQVAYTLGRPYGFLLYNFAQRLGLGLNRVLVFMLPGWLLGTLAVGPWLPATSLIAVSLAAAVVLSISIQFFLHAAVAMIAFWFEENSAFIWIFAKITLVAGTLMPLEFLPATWQAALHWTPFPWLAWAPARLAVLPADTATSDILFLLGGQAAWLVAAILIASAVFRLAVRHTTVQGG